MLSPEDLDAYLEKLGTSTPTNARFRMLCAFARRVHAEGGCPPQAEAAAVALMAERIAGWPVETRIAPDEWWMDLRWEDDVYEYGYNNGGGAPAFFGFRAEPDWLMPLARVANLTNPMIDFQGKHLQGFLQSPAIGYLLHLRIGLPAGPALVMGMLESGRFGQLAVLETPYLQGLDKAQLKAFAKWKQVNGIASHGAP